MRTKLSHRLSYLLCLFQIPCFAALQRIPLHSSSFSGCGDEHKKIEVVCDIHSEALQIEQKNLGNELLVYGFIREFEPKVTNKIIPDCIINLCFHFSRRMLPCDCIKGKFRELLPKLDIDGDRKKAVIFLLMYKIEDVQDEKDKLGKTILHYACKMGQFEIVKLLRKWGANLNAKNKYGNNALHYACIFSDSVFMTNWLLDVCQIDIETKGYKQKTPFIWAAEKGQLGIAKLLKDRDANINAKEERGSNALHYACAFSGSVPMVTWLLDVCKIDIETKGDAQMTPFLCAAEKGQLGIAKLLKKRGADINAKNKYGNNALHQASLSSGSVSMVTWLLDECIIGIETKGYRQKTPFLCAVREGQLGTAKLLKGRGANINAKDEDGNNALYLAKEDRNNKEMLRYLESEIRTKVEGVFNFWSSWF